MSDDQPKSANQAIDMMVAIFIAMIVIYFLPFAKSDHHKATAQSIHQQQAKPKTYKFGFDTDRFHLETFSLNPNEFIGEILNANQVPNRKIHDLEVAAKDIFSVRKIRAGKNLTLVSNDTCGPTACMVYEPDPFRYVVYDFRDSVQVKIVEKPFVEYTKTASGKIESSLWVAMKDRGLSPALIDKMEEALAWSVDFHHTQKGDEFKLIYKQKYIDGKAVTVGDLIGAYYKNNLEHYAVKFETDDYDGYYDLEGRPTKKAFLKSPVKFSRISSRYNLRRFHPIQKRVKAHLGTDYAAPHGTPIRAVANGTIETASYTRGNGKYVRIKHDKTYKTQYLHMSRFAKGMRRGASVKQGQTIGYVGSTGLATGPHVCFRFWKNGKQIDHLRENFPPPKPMKEEDLPAFYVERDRIMTILDYIRIEEDYAHDLLASK